MAAVKVPQTLEYRAGQLNAAPVLEVKILQIRKRADQRKPKAQWTADERKAANLDQHRKSLIMSVLPDDQMNSVINFLTIKSTWDDLILYHERPSDVKESRVMDLKLCYNTFKFKEDSPNDEEDTRNSHEYLNDLEKEYQAKALLAKSKRFFQKDTKRFSSANATDQTECHKCGKKGHFASDCWTTKDFEAKYNKVKAKLALLSSSASAPSSFSSKNKVLIAESHDWDKEEVSLDDEETKVKALMVLTDEERISVGKESARNSEWSKITIKSNLHKSSEAKDSTLLNHDTAEKLDGVKSGSRPKTVKLILKSKSMFKAKTLKGITLNESSSAPTRGNKISSAYKTNSTPAGKLKNVNVEDDPPLAMVIKELNELNLQISKKKSSYSRNKNTQQMLLRSGFLRLGMGKRFQQKELLERVSFLLGTKAQLGAKLGAKTRQMKPATSSKQPFVSSKEATKGGSSKAPTGSKTGHSKRRKESSSAMDSNLNRPSVSTPIDTKMHKEDQQSTGGPTSLRVTTNFTAEADPGLSAPNDSIPPQQDQTKSVSDGLETVLTQPTIEKGASSTSIHGDKEEDSTAIHGDKEEASSTIKLEDLAKLVSQIQPNFKDLDLPEDDPVIIVEESDEDEPNAKTKDTSVPRSLSSRYSQIKELTNQVLILQSKKHKLEIEKNKAEAEAALLKAQPSFLNVEQLNELLVKSLQTEFSKILSSHNFSSSLPTELKDLPSKFNELTEEIKGLKTQVHELEIELPKELKKIPTKLEYFTKTATSLTPPRSSSQPEGEHIKKDKGKKHIHLSKEQINNQKKLEKEAKAKAAKQEGELRKVELIDLLGPEMAIDYAAGRRLKKLRLKEAWETIEDLAQHEEKEWNDPFFLEKESPNYIDTTLEHELESMECRVKSLMRNEVLLEYEVIFDEKKLEILRKFHWMIL
uniref:Zf-CCHC domain-containing protein/DUF4219 domain-containing protein/UBN2 domain-containing protein n=1 Tax=Tanacetum cinerariifolium TaxID=118510 RepID=A0A6L2NS64_TANCI|nr:zf-CCHC domain-containing protein/DUF4219 domain-containing protein/UBN2 domain-containing protein [Tanacetum cinerariifolium]